MLESDYLKFIAVILQKKAERAKKYGIVTEEAKKDVLEAKKMARAERFNLEDGKKKARAERFGIVSPDSKSTSSSITSPKVRN